MKTLTTSKCEELVREATEASNHSLDISARIFEDAAKCFDRFGKRKKAGQYLTMAGDFFLDLDNKEKAATCYGKAIMRHLMVDDIETAEILLEKGKNYGFSSTTHQYRIAIDALERQKTEKTEEEIDEEKISEEENLPDIDILPIEDETEEELIPLDTDLLSSDENTLPKKQEFIIPQLEKEEPSTLGSFAVLAAVSQATRQKSTQDIQTNAIIKGITGESQFVKPQFSINPFRSVEEFSTETTEESPIVETDMISEPDDHSFLEEFRTNIDDKESKTDYNTTTHNDFKSEDTVKTDYAAKTEIINEFEEELVDVEIVNTIPFNFEVVNVKTDFELDDKKSTSDGLVFTWRKDKIEPGKKMIVEYILRKRVERSIILRKENKVSVINSYHSIKQDMKANMDFVNTSGMIFHEILIEDIIPPELVVNKSDSPKNIKPITIPTHDSTLYRWIFSELFPGDNFLVNYEFRERPLTRHYKDEFEFDTGIAKIEKISQPILDTSQCEYIWYYSLKNSTSDKVSIVDRIPLDFSILLVDPPHLTPSINKEKAQQLLTWKIDSDEEFTTIIMRIGGLESFTPLAPTLETPQGENFQLVKRSTSSDKKLVDIRRLKNKIQESL